MDSRAKTPILASFAVALTAIAVGAVGLANAFTQDDLGLIAQTERLHGLAHWREILTLPYWPPPYVPDLYRPVTSLLLALQWDLGGGSAAVYRVGSVLLSLATALAFLGLARRLLPPAIAAGAALLFAAHPVHVEAVALAVAQS